MGTTTSNFNLIKPAEEDFYDIADQNNNMDIIDAELKGIKDAGEASRLSINKVQADTELNSNSINNISDLISSGAVQTPKLAMGANKITIPDVPVSPRIEFTGMSYVNLLGKDGNCEDIGKWNAYAYSTNTLDTTLKVFGGHSIKITLTGSSGGFAKAVDGFLDKTKYYFISAYLANGNGTSISLVKDASNGGLHKGSSVTSASMTRVGIKVAPSDFASSGNNIAVLLQGSSGQYGYADGIMVMEVSLSEYTNLSVAELLAKYAYVESYGALTNPYFENRRYNLVRNGNCEEGTRYWRSSDTATTSMTIENGRFKVVSTASYGYFYQIIKVKPNTVYSISGNVSGNGILYVDNRDITTVLANGKASFNTGAYSEIAILLHGGSTVGTSYFNSIMLVEGTTTSAEYKSCDLQRFAVEGQFTQDDRVVIENGKVSGALNWKHITSYGKDYNWSFANDQTGFRQIKCPNPLNAKTVLTGSYLVKYDGSILRETTAGIADCFYVWSDGYTYIDVSDNDTGWTEYIHPNDDEVKAFMNGWRAGTNNGTRYTGWVSVVDNTIPSSLVATAAYGTNASGQNKLNVVDAAKFAVNEWIYLVGDDKWVNTYQISAISGNQLTLTYNLTANVSTSNSIAKQDQTQIAWVKNNIAPNYEGYQLHYKLANPEPVTDINVHVQGDIWDLVKGDNNVTVDSGIVLGEVNATGYDTNNNKYIGTSNNISGAQETARAPLTNKAEDIFAVYRNRVYDPYWTKYYTPIERINGKVCMYEENEYFDTNAVYTVDYQILNTLHAQSFGNIAISYNQSLLSALESHSKELEQKQKQDSTLDTLIDISIYENTCGQRFFYNGRANKFNSDIIHTYGYFIIFPKKVKPIITVKNVGLSCNNGLGGSVSISQSDLLVGVNYIHGGQIKIVVSYIGKDATIQTNLLNYGYSLYHDGIIADCRGRI